VLYRAHVPILNVEYEELAGGGPYYRDCQPRCCRLGGTDIYVSECVRRSRCREPCLPRGVSPGPFGEARGVVLLQGGKAIVYVATYIGLSLDVETVVREVTTSGKKSSMLGVPQGHGDVTLLVSPRQTCKPTFQISRT